MRSTAATVDEYLDTVPADRRAVLAQLRQLCLEYLTGYDEAMTYGMPGYSRNGTLEVGFNSQKHYVSLYILNKDVLDKHRQRFTDAGKGCIRYKKPEDIDFSVVVRILRDTVTSDATMCP
ncbi:MAG: DUF1801 domain-containing protein [Pseudonocardiaceae bacterium]|nr:DUF1801 domain-containing protein [Pseudonocardiaceae bacterium]